MIESESVLAITAGGCILLFVLAAILFYNYRVIRSQNRALYTQIEEYTLSTEKGANQHTAETNHLSLEESYELSLEETTPATGNEVANKELFVRLEAIMHNEGLYLQPTLSRDEVIARLGTNKNKLNEAIQQEVKLTYSEYLTELRLQKAILIMVEEPDIPIIQIGERVGYSTYSSFYRAFYKRLRIKPTNYRDYINQ